MNNSVLLLNLNFLVKKTLLFDLTRILKQVDLPIFWQIENVTKNVKALKNSKIECGKIIILLANNIEAPCKQCMKYAHSGLFRFLLTFG